MPLDIRTRAVQETVTFDLCDADDTPLTDDEGKPCSCTIHGPGSRRYVQATAARQAKLLEKISRRSGYKETPEDQARMQAEFLAAITDRLDLSYGDMPDGREKFLAIYSDPGVGFIAEQVTKRCHDWALFKKGSSAN